MRNFLSIALHAATIFTLAACTPDDSINRAAEQSLLQFEEKGVQNMKNDALFVAEAASANMLMVQLSERAKEKAVSPEVKDLARQMQHEHEQVLEEINTIAAQGPFVLPATLGESHQKTYDNINARSGLPFDLAYIKEAVESHKNLLKRYEDMAKNGVSMDVKQFASRQVPLARQHLETAQKLEHKVSSI